LKIEQVQKYRDLANLFNNGISKYMRFVSWVIRSILYHCRKYEKHDGWDWHKSFEFAYHV